MNVDILRGVAYELIEVNLDKIKQKNNIGFVICHQFALLNMSNLVSVTLIPEKKEKKYLNPICFPQKEFKKNWYQKTKFLKRYGTVFYDDWNVEFVFNEINFNVFGHRNSTKVGIRYKIKTNMNTEVVANEIVSRLGAVENAIVNEK